MKKDMYNYKKSEEKLTEEQVAKIADKYSINPWTKKGTDRYYLNMSVLEDLIGLSVDYYKTGNARDCFYMKDGKKENVANRRAFSRSDSKVYIEDGIVYSNWNPYSGDNIAELVASQIRANF